MFQIFLTDCNNIFEKIKMHNVLGIQNEIKPNCKLKNSVDININIPSSEQKHLALVSDLYQ